MLVFIATISFMACDEENDIEIVEANHRVIVTSEASVENTINIGGHIDFGDISRGIESRTWTFPEGATIVGEKGNTSSKDVIKGFFSIPGEHNVTLNQVFKGNVYPNEDSTTPIEGKVLDTTIVVTVLGPISSVLKAHYLNDDGSVGAELNMSDNAENVLTASKYIQLTYESQGEPSNFVWNLDGGKPNQITNPGGAADVRYNKVGSWDLQFIASRARPGGADTVNIKKFIKVIPSTEPVVVDKVTNKEVNIAIEYSREMDESSLNKNDFAVTIETTAGAVLNPAISKVSVDAVDGNIVILELDGETIYNDDIIKVSYTPGALTTLDGVAADALTDAELVFAQGENILKNTSVDYSFETSTAANWPYLWWGGQWGEYDFAISGDQAQDGSSSAYLEFRPNGGMIIGHRDAAGNDLTFPVESGERYEMGVWVYVTDLGEINGGETPDLRFYWAPGTDWGIAPNPALTDDFVIGEWVYSSTIVQFAESGEVNYMIRGINNGNSLPVKLYMDNISVVKLTTRP